MIEKKRINYTKKDISINLSNKLGLSNSYSLLITDSLIQILKELMRARTVNIKNFGTFKTIHKNERLGRNPKNNTIYTIAARKVLSFTASKRLNEYLNN
tara:strand:- start:177 stop:473 length:297 start_codon:yes stop_codon:yes gene_type:complete